MVKNHNKRDKMDLETISKRKHSKTTKRNTHSSSGTNSKVKEVNTNLNKPCSSMASGGKKRELKEEAKNAKYQKELKSLMESYNCAIKLASRKIKTSDQVLQQNDREEETEDLVGDLSQVKPMKVFRPTEAEFKEPILYIEKLYKEGASRYGCIKIIPPTSFNPSFSFDENSEAKLPFRSQVLQELKRGKAFEHHKEGIVFKDFKNNAMELEDNYLKAFKFKSDSHKIKELEKDYWSIIEATKSKAFDKCEFTGKFITNNEKNKKVFNVDYAADLQTDKYGSGFPTIDQNKVLGMHPWNFKNLNNRPDSLLQFCKDEAISGINIPWLYIGMLYSSFCWHYEDIMMYSINYMHQGFGKMWYGIPLQDGTKFERVAKQKHKDQNKEDPNFLLNINTMISPGYLVERGVTVYSTLQKPGEFILTFPGSYHAGFSAGFNVAEAVNFSAPSWLNYVERAMDIYFKSREKVPVFPFQWLVIENLLNNDVEIIEDVNKDHFTIDESSSHSVFTKGTYQKLLEIAEKTVKDEIIYRNIAREDFNKKLKSKKMYEEKLKDSDDVDKISNECYFCVNLPYASFLECSKCKIRYCSYHGLHCKCSAQYIKLKIRFTDDELKEALLRKTKTKLNA